MKFKKAALFLLTAAFSGGLTTSGLAFELFPTDPEDYIKSRAYVGAFGTSADISQDGDFSGLFPFTGSFPPYTETTLIPAITRNFGFGGLAGRDNAG